MRKTLISVLIIGVVAALVAAGTFAIFSDTATGAATSLNTGVLDITLLDGASTVQAPVSFANMIPGIWYETDVTVHNHGAYEELYKISFTNSGSTLAQALQVQVYRAWKVGETPGYVYSGLLSACVPGRLGTSGGVDQEYRLVADDTDTYRLFFSLPSTAGNEYQDRSATANLVVSAIQFTPDQATITSGKP